MFIAYFLACVALDGKPALTDELTNYPNQWNCIIIIISCSRNSSSNRTMTSHGWGHVTSLAGSGTSRV